MFQEWDTFSFMTVESVPFAFLHNQNSIIEGIPSDSERSFSNKNSAENIGKSLGQCKTLPNILKSNHKKRKQSEMSNNLIEENIPKKPKVEKDIQVQDSMIEKCNLFICKHCKKECKNIRLHLKKNKKLNCEEFYSPDELEELSLRSKMKRAENDRKWKNNNPKKKAESNANWNRKNQERKTMSSAN